MPRDETPINWDTVTCDNRPGAIPRRPAQWTWKHDLESIQQLSDVLYKASKDDRLEGTAIHQEAHEHMMLMARQMKLAKLAAMVTDDSWDEAAEKKKARDRTRRNRE